MSTTNKPVEDDEAIAKPMKDVEGRERPSLTAGTPEQSIEDAVERSVNDLAIERRAHHSVSSVAPADAAARTRSTPADER